MDSTITATEHIILTHASSDYHITLSLASQALAAFSFVENGLQQHCATSQSPFPVL